MSIVSRLFGTKPSSAPPPPEPKPIDPSVLEWRRLNILTVPKLKRLPLDAKAVEAAGSPSTLHPPVKPARVIDEVPVGYQGELYYRIVASQHGSQCNPFNYVSVRQRGLKLEDQPGQWLGVAMMSHVAQGREQHLFTAPGELRSELRHPLPAKLGARATKKPFPEWHDHSWPMVSARFRRVVEALEPGVHLFIPLDTSEGQREPELYVFYPGVIFFPTALAIEASDIARKLTPAGFLEFTRPTHLSTRHFYMLNRNVVGSAEIFAEGWFGPVFSKRALERLGDVLQRELAFMPIGVCDETCPPNTRKCTRDGDVLPIAPTRD